MSYPTHSRIYENLSVGARYDLKKPHDNKEQKDQEGKKQNQSFEDERNCAGAGTAAASAAAGAAARP